MGVAKLNVLVSRTFSSSAVRSQLAKVPLQLFGLEGRYATALYTAAVKQKQLESVEKDLQKIKNTLQTDKPFREFTASPIISRPLKINAMADVSKKLGLTSSSTNLLALLAENGRLKNLPSIINDFQKIMSAHRGDLTVEVTSAKLLDDATRQELASTLQKFASKGENTIITYKVNEALIGGLIVSIGDRYVDMSIASKVKKYSDVLQSTI